MQSRGTANSSWNTYFGTQAPPQGYEDIAEILLPEELGDLTLARNPSLQTTLSRARRARVFRRTLEGLQLQGRKRDAARLLSSSGGGVAFTVSNDYHTFDMAADEYVIALRTVLGLPPPLRTLYPAAARTVRPPSTMP